MSDARALSPDESGVLCRVLSSGSFEGVDELIAQVPRTRVVGGIPTLLDLAVVTPATAASCPDGPLPLRAFVEGLGSDVEGEIIVWVKNGYLSGLEFAWFTDEGPTAFRLRTACASRRCEAEFHKKAPAGQPRIFRIVRPRPSR